MKFFSSILGYFATNKTSRKNLGALVLFLALLFGIIALYSILFHFIMAAEGRDFSWISGVYWTLVVMSTLGFGDIIFTSDLGMVFSIVVLLSGIVFLLVLLPFTIIKYFFAPWLEEQSRRRYPQELPPSTRGHVIITEYDSVTTALIEKLTVYKRSYIVIVDDYERSKELYDKNVRIAVGPLDDPATYLKMQIHSCALLVAASRDELNANIAFTVRELNETVPIIATANSPHSVDILEMAGCSKVIELPEILGRSLTRWVLGGHFQANTLARLENLLIVETPAASTPLVGKSLAESRLRELLGVTVVGVWERGSFELATGTTMINRSTVLILAGTQAQIDKYDEVYSFYQITKHAGDPVIILGAGRVGEAIAEKLQKQGVTFTVIEKNPRRVKNEHYILGDAADIQTLHKAGLEKSPAVLITTHDDATNIYLAKYLRNLRPGLQIISRANLERNVSTLYRAGADFVMSYASLGANTIFNFLMNNDMFMLAEGLNIFRLETPRPLIGKNLVESNIRQTTGCTVIGIVHNGAVSINPDPGVPLQAKNELIMTGTHEAELLFLKTFR